jgi:sec-independent protein translocase protein TatA
MGGLSITHLLVVLIVALLLFGAGRVADVGKGLGEGIRNFKKGLKDEDADPPVKRKAVVADDDDEVEIVRVPKQLAVVAPVAGTKKKKVIQIEVDEDADEEEVARLVAAKRKAKAAASEDEKAT